MSLEILARAAELAQEGAPDAAIALLKPLLGDESLRRQAVPVMASCYERKKDYATAAHLYLEATRLDPKHPDWPKRLQACIAQTAEAVAQAEAAPGWGKGRTALALVLLALSASAVVVAKAMPEFLPFDQAVPTAFYGGITLATVAVALLLVSLKCVLTRSARVGAARGTDYSKIPMRTCWSCVLPTPAKFGRCLFCDSPRKRPAIPSQDPATTGLPPDQVPAGASRPLSMTQSAAAPPSAQVPVEMPPVTQTAKVSAPLPDAPKSVARGAIVAAGAVATGLIVLYLLWKLFITTSPVSRLHGSGYQVDYKIGDNGARAVVKTTVRGPAAKLAVILTDPKGKSRTEVIGKEDMISNSHTVQVAMSDWNSAEEGKYQLKVKTIDPERVVWQTALQLSIGKLAFRDVRFDFTPEPWGKSGYCLQSIGVVFEHTGDLPVMMRGLPSITMDGKPWDGVILAGIVIHPEGTVYIQHGVRDVFKPGERHVMKGRLWFVKGLNNESDENFVDFEKEFVVSANSPQNTGTANAGAQTTSRTPRVGRAGAPAPSPGGTPAPMVPKTFPSLPTKPAASMSAAANHAEDNLFSDNFTGKDGQRPASWKFDTPDTEFWRMEKGWLATGNGDNFVIFPDGYSYATIDTPGCDKWEDYRISCKFWAKQKDGSIALVGRWKDRLNFYRTDLDTAEGNTILKLAKVVKGQTTVLATEVLDLAALEMPPVAEGSAEKPTQFSLSFEGNIVSVQMNGRQMLRKSDLAFSAGTAGLGERADEVLFGDVKVAVSPGAGLPKLATAATPGAPISPARQIIERINRAMDGRSWSEAEDLINQLEKIQPDNPLISVKRAMIKNRKESISEGQAALTETLQKEIADLKARAKAAEDRQDLQAAYNLWMVVLAKNPSDKAVADEATQKIRSIKEKLDEMEMRARVGHAQSDMLSMATALEAFSVAHNTYPVRLGQLTTPVQYITTISPDPFAADDGQGGDKTWLAYAPVNLQDDRSQMVSRSWILVSRGPDGVFSIDLERDMPSDTALKRNEANRILTAKTYDPTNGTVSAGDIFRLGGGQW